jgi:hypothetical protein
MMKWIVILFLEFFTMYFEMQILVIHNNHDLMLEWMVMLALLGLKIRILNICMWNENMLL